MSNGPHKTVIKDDLGREHVFATPPRRIVSLVPSLTETIVFLGAKEKLVGITDYCIRPEGTLAAITRIGGTKNPDIAKILSLPPDLVIANKEENEKRHIEALEREVPVFLTYPRSVQDTAKTVRDLGIILEAENTAERFTSAIAAFLHSIKSDPPFSQPLRTACMVWRNPWMAAGPDTYASNLLGVFGFENVVPDLENRYPKMTLDAVLERKPDVILLPDEPYDFGDEDKAFVADFLGKRNATSRVELIDGAYLTWFGSRTLEALVYLKGIRRRLA